MQTAERYVRTRFATVLAVVTVSLGVSHRSVCAAQLSEDHLIPADDFLANESRKEYRKLWEQKLLVTPGDTARFIGLPGTFGEETAVSVYQASKDGGMPGGYWVTATQATTSLWNHLQGPGGKPTMDARAIPIQRCDAPLPESTACTVRDVWRALLLQTRPEPDSGTIGLDGSTEIVSATTSTGATLRARVPDEPGSNTLALVNIANSLMRYCDIPAAERPELARQIEKAATELLMRIQPKK